MIIHSAAHKRHNFVLAVFMSDIGIEFQRMLTPMCEQHHSATSAFFSACRESPRFLFRIGSLLVSELSISCWLALGRSLEYHLTGPAETRLISLNLSSGDLFPHSPPLAGRFGDITVSPTNETCLFPHSTRTVAPWYKKGHVMFVPGITSSLTVPV